MATKIRNFWNGFQYDDISVVTLLRERGVTLPGLHFSAIAALGLSGLIVVGWQNPKARWVAAAVLLHMTALLSVFITERYRLAAVPGLLILGSLFIGQVLETARQRQWLPAAALAALVAVTAWATDGRTSDPELLSVDPYNMGVKELEVAEGLLARQGPDQEVAAARATASRELDSAQQHLELAHRHLPRSASVTFALGNVAMARGSREEARRWYEQTLSFSPSHTGAQKNLGYLLLEEGRWSDAIPLLEAARTAEPENASTWYLLARAHLGLGDQVSARSMLTEALRLKPTQAEFIELSKKLAPPQISL
jgi:tetratricopeptide (TPR) repeat protein